MPDSCQSFTSCCAGTPFDYQVSSPPPIVDAGPDQEVTTDELTLSGSTNGSFWQWSQKSGVPVTILSPQDLNSAVQKSEDGTAILTLTAQNVCGQSEDDVTITFLPEEACNFDLAWNRIDTTNVLLAPATNFSTPGLSGPVSLDPLTVENVDGNLSWNGHGVLTLTAHGNLLIEGQNEVNAEGIASVNARFQGYVYYVLNGGAPVGLAGVNIKTGNTTNGGPWSIPLVDGDVLELHVQTYVTGWASGDVGFVSVICSEIVVSCVTEE